ncbi:putative transcription factor C2H2 family [Helianthus annuus]|nr:putative transcription factor C2H2 family [Helianthus annuus]
MGGKSSKEGSYRHSSSFQSGSSSFTGSQYGSSPQQSYSYPPPPHYAAPVQEAYPAYPQHYAAPFPSTVPAPAPAPAPSRPQKKLDRRYSRIADNYSSLEQVTEALARAGLESSNLIVGIDFTKSNEWTGNFIILVSFLLIIILKKKYVNYLLAKIGSRSFNRKSLHHIGDNLNPYEQAITIIGKTLAAFDEDNLIPCFGFGDASTHDQDVFSFYSEERFCNGFEEVLSRYREITPHLKLAGPTSFAPVIEQAMTIVEQSGGQYHVLLIIADGQVTRSVDTEPGNLSPQEQRTVDAIVQASKLPLSIVLVGVGDGPWDMMREFDDNIPARDFDNFQFVNFTEIMSKNVPPMRKETEFALSALMEIPTQYKATIELNILGGRKGISPNRVALPPPIHSASSYSSSKPSHSSSFQKGSQFNYGQTSPVSSAGSYYDQMSSQSPAPPASNSTYDNQVQIALPTCEFLVCPICLTNQKDMAFGCGHQTCCECGQTLQLCPICRKSIETRIKLY